LPRIQQQNHVNLFWLCEYHFFSHLGPVIPLLLMTTSSKIPGKHASACSGTQNRQNAVQISSIHWLKLIKYKINSDFYIIIYVKVCVISVDFVKNPTMAWPKPALSKKF